MNKYLTFSIATLVITAAFFLPEIARTAEIPVSWIRDTTAGLIKPGISTDQVYSTDDFRFDTEILPDGALCADGEILKKTGADNWDCAADATGAGSGAFSDAGDPAILNTTSKDVAIGATLINSAKLSIDGDDDQVQFAIQGHSTQTNPLVVFEDSSGKGLFSLTTTQSIHNGISAKFTSSATVDGTLYTGNIQGGGAGSTLTLQSEQTSNSGLVMEYGKYFAGFLTIEGQEGAGGGVDFRGFTPTSGNQTGGILNFQGGDGFGSGSGGNFDAIGGDGGATGAGGNVTFTGGAGGATSGNGGLLLFDAGAAGGSGNGGNISFNTGVGAGNGNGGNLTFSIGSGAGSGSDGALVIAQGGASNVTLDFSRATSARQIDFPDISGVLLTNFDVGTVTSTTILDGTILEVDLDIATASPADNEILTFNTGGNFDWHTLGELGIQAQDAVLDDLSALSVVADNEFIVGTGAGTYAHESGATARTSLGVAIGTDVQAWDAELDTIAALTETNGAVMFVAGGAWTADLTPAIDCSDCTNVGGAETNTLETTITGIESSEIFIGTGTNNGLFLKLTGDVTLQNDGVVTINPNSVALATDTTGNYVATVADAGNSTITVAGSGSENASVTLDLTANGVDDTHIDWGTGAGQVSIADLTGTQTSGAITWDFTSASAVSFADLSITGNVTPSDGKLWNFSTINNSNGSEGILLPQSTDCSTAVSEGQICWESDAENLWIGDGTAAVQMNGAASGDSITVNSTAVDTTANFLDSIYGDFDIADGGAGGPDDVTFTIEYGQTLAGNPALAVDQCIPFADTSGGGFLCEGSTADTSEQLYRFPDLNGADTTEYIVVADDANVSAAEAGWLDGVSAAIVDTGDAVATAITGTGTLTAGTWNATAIGAQYGGTGLDTSASTGLTRIDGGTWSVAELSGDITTSGSNATSIAANVVDFADILYTNTLAGNPALAVDECYPLSTAGGGGFICEGSTDNTNEQLYLFPDLDGADTTEYIIVADDANVSAAEAGWLDGVTAAIADTDDTLAVFANTTSAQLTGILTDEDGTGECGAGLICVGGHEHAGANLTDDIFVLNAGDTMTGALNIDGSADALQLIVEGNSTQTNPIFTVRDSTGGNDFTVTTTASYFDGTVFMSTPLAATEGGTGATTLNDLIALTTHTTGNYAAGDGEAGNALTGDSATAFFSSGAIEAARGGTGGDSSGSTGLARVDAGTWSYSELSGDVVTSGSNATVIQDNSVDGTDIQLGGSPATGDIMYYNGTDWVALAASTSGLVLHTNGPGTAPTWDTDDGAGGSPWTTDTNVVNLNTDTDSVTIGSNTNFGKLAIDGDADEIQFNIQANSTQTNPILVIEDSTGAPYYSMTTTAGVYDGIFLKTTSSSQVDGTLYIAQNLEHIGDSDTYMEFTSDDRFSFIAGGLTILSAIESINSSLTVNNNSVDVDFRINGASGVMFSADAGLDAIIVDNSVQFAIPDGTACTANSTGEICIDTSAANDQLIVFGDVESVFDPRMSFSFHIATPSQGGVHTFKKLPYNITVTDIHCIINNGTSSVIELFETTSTGASPATLDASITCDSDGAEDDGALSNGVLDANDWFQVQLGAVTGIVSAVDITVFYTVNRE